MKTLKSPSVIKEFCRDQLPMILGTFLLGIIAGYLQAGYLPGSDRPFPVGQITVSIWHLVFMGFWTGYIMGLVGEASGIFSMPYSMTILHFDSVSLSPTSLITTFLNPFGALFGYWRSGQWNLDLALWLCVGAILGSPIGPFIRVFWLTDPDPFKMVIGMALFLMSVHLMIQVTPWYLKRTARQQRFKKKFDQMMEENRNAGKTPSGLPDDFEIKTIERSIRIVRIRYWDEEQTFSVPLMVCIGFIVGIVASALGVGGGFMLVPIMVTVFGIPMYVLVAATVPFVITLSVTSLLSYVFTVPLLTGATAKPDWAFGLFVASGAILGAWVAAKTQKYIPEKILKPLLAAVTGLVGALYIVNFFWKLPFNL